MPESPSSDLGEQDCPAKSIVLRLNTLYTWIAEAFAALDLDDAGVIQVASNGDFLQQSLAGAGLEQMWTMLDSETHNEQDITQDTFRIVYLRWMGLSDSWAVTEGLQRSRGVEVSGVLSLTHSTAIHSSSARAVLKQVGLLI